MQNALTGRIEVAVPTPLHQTFTYLSEEPVHPGQRVMVSFGGRRLVGVVTGEGRPEGSSRREGKRYEIKPIGPVVDQEPVFSETLLQLGAWLSRYYLCPIGEVYRAMLPAGTESVKKKTCRLSAKGQRLISSALSSDPAAESLRYLFENKPEITVATATSRWKKSPFKESISFSALLESGLISVTRGTEVRPRSLDTSDRSPCGGLASPGEDVSHPLTEEQASALALMLDESRQQKKRPILLHGVTGSGKTELYLQLIAATLRQPGQVSGQVLVLVPEISLTPQTTRIFSSRFPGQVAVVHSGLAPSERWAQMARVHTGEVGILIGPRSAVFAPFQNLQVILVDEEHDGSYKQATGLAYNGRDVAVMRAQMESALCVLGSATPSLESFHNALSQRYLLVRMPNRVQGRPLPKAHLIEAKPSFRKAELVDVPEPVRAVAEGVVGLETPIAEEIQVALRETLARGEQSMVIVNRRGYAMYLFSLEKREAVGCPHCSISLTLHNQNRMLRCHYCDYRASVHEIIQSHPGQTFAAVGFGSESLEPMLRSIMPTARVARIDSDTASKKDALPQTLQAFRRGDLDILVGTQILSKGHDFPRVTLICLLELDFLLDFPDFRAGERTYQLIVQAAGRAGRDQFPGKVLIQSMRPNHPVVLCAVEQNFLAFAERELAFREAHHYPPFSRMIAIELSSTELADLQEAQQRIERWLEQFAALRTDVFAQTSVRGPVLPPIAKLRGRHRRLLLCSSASSNAVHEFVRAFLVAFETLRNRIRIHVDVDPQTLM